MSLRHTSRIRGFHVRQHVIDERQSQETQAFTCQIWRGDTQVGSARNSGRGGADVIHIAREHRGDWEALVAELAAFPDWIGPNGDFLPPTEVDSTLLGILRYLDVLDAEVATGERARSAAVVHRWEDDGDMPMLERSELCSPRADFPLDAVPPEYGRIVLTQRDNQEFLRSDTRALPRR